MNTTTASKAFRSPRAPGAGDALGRGLADPLGAGDPLGRPVQALGEVGEQLPSSSGGSSMPAGLRQGMEASYGADFSNVKVHTDGAGGAKAFARGEHMHFAPGQFDPHSVGGREKIGHELGHVQQQRADRVPVPQFSDFPVNDDPGLEGEADREGAKAARGEKAQIAGNTRGLASEKGAAQGWEWPWAKKKAAEKLVAAGGGQQAAGGQAGGQGGGQEMAPIVPPAEQQAAPPPVADPDAQNHAQPIGPRGLRPGEGARLGKDAVADTAAKSAVVGLGAAAMLTKPTAEAAGAVTTASAWGQGSPAGGMLFGTAGAGAAIAGGFKSRDRQLESRKSGDKAGEKIGAQGVKDSSLAALQGGVGAAAGAVDAANVAKNGAGAVMQGAKTAGELAAQGGNALAIASVGLGIGGNALAFIQAAYEGGSAIKRWRKLATSAGKIKSSRGQTWHDRVKNRSKWKTALQALKFAAAGIGIAAGALMLVSNPVGWALGLAAAATMGVMAIGKLAGGLKRKWEQKSAGEALQNAKPGAASGAASESAAKTQVQSQAAEVRAEPPAPEVGGGEPPPPEAQEATPKKKEMVRSRADEAAVMCSTNAKVASEMIGAIWLFRNDTQGAIADVAKGDWTRVDEHTDAMALVYLLGVDEEAAMSASGQELIENKISAVNGL